MEPDSGALWCAGVVQVPLQVSKDTCLYAETYIARVVARDNANDAAKLAQIDTGLDYYAVRSVPSACAPMGGLLWLA